MSDVVMPKLSESMEEGTILSWLKSPGDDVHPGDELVEIETDKATVAHVAEADGALEILAPEGATVSVGAVIARIGVSAPPPAPPAPADPVHPVAGKSEQGATETVSDSRAVVGPDTAAPPIGAGGGHRSLATPLAQRIAAAHSLPIDEVEGSGPLGRITRLDVLRRLGLDPGARTPALDRGATLPAPGPGANGRDIALPPPETPPETSASAPSTQTAEPGQAGMSSSPGGRRQELSRLQQVIARRMAEAKATIPHFQVQTEVWMDGAVALRLQLKDARSGSDCVPSLNDLIIKAAAMALRDHPLANGSYKDGAFELHEAVNVGFAVAVDGALVVPTVFDAARRSLLEIARATRTLAARVRSGEITPPELSGATFTVSNLGMFGMTAITPVINPPQAAILGVGALRGSLAREDDQIVERALLTLTLSCDHRILYGADAARFLADVRQLLETPLRLVL